MPESDQPKIDSREKRLTIMAAKLLLGALLMWGLIYTGRFDIQHFRNLFTGHGLSSFLAPKDEV